MGRLTWLAAELRRAGLEVVEVDGWKTRGATAFNPVGVTWHATAGSKHATAQGEVGVILNGSATAPPPIAQLMIFRDGVVYVCAAGRCNHNKVGWAGRNKGLGNSALLGIEMANNNRGEPFPEVQLRAARHATAAIMRRLGADPRGRLAGHYEHQPKEGKPPGERSTKTDPKGVDMSDERARVAALMDGHAGFAAKLQEDDMTPDQDARLKRLEAQLKQLTAKLDGLPAAEGRHKIGIVGTDDGTGQRIKRERDTVRANIDQNFVQIKNAVVTVGAALTALSRKDVVDEKAIATALLPLLTDEDIEDVVRAGRTPDERRALADRLQG
jgi:hypothetical protein